MATFVYVARRSLLPGHIVDQTYQLEIDTQASAPRRQVDKNDVRARGGATETLYHRADREWSITFAPVSGRSLDELIEFLDSTESGELFQMQIFSASTEFVTVKRADVGYELQEFLASGGERIDHYTTQITVRAV